jgi:hypothetical protein
VRCEEFTINSPATRLRLAYDPWDDAARLEGHPYLADKAYMAALERTCAMCPATGACRRWMSRAGPVGAHRRFCPNAFEFDLMAKAMVERSDEGAMSHGPETSARL